MVVRVLPGPPRACGRHALHIGEDPILWTDRFTLEGGAIGEARRAVRKAEHAGLVVRQGWPGEAFEPGLADELRAVSQEWLHDHAGGEKSFCMGRFDPRHLSRSWRSVAWNPARRRVEGFTTWEPIPARQGWALDLMRRRRDAAEGTMELLVVRAVETARERGDAMLSLGLSALARVDADEAPGPAEADRARAFLTRHLGRFYDFRGLFTWKKKFAPAFEDRYLVYPGALALPRVALALARAQSPGGFRSYLGRLRPAGRTRGAA